MTYGDLMTLLLTFFVLLFTFTTIQDARFEAVLYYLREALGLLDAGTTLELDMEPTVMPGEMQDELDMMQDDAEAQREEREQAELEEMAEEMQNYIEEQGLENEVVVDVEERGLIIRMYDSVLFDLGSAELRPEAGMILDQVAGMLRERDKQVRAEGHTDDLPISTYRYPSNWELSVGRATAVVRYLVEAHDMPPDHLSAAGYGEYRPLVPHERGGQPRNRRVDLVVLRGSESDVEPGSPEETREEVAE